MTFNEYGEWVSAEQYAEEMVYQHNRQWRSLPARFRGSRITDLSPADRDAIVEWSKPPRHLNMVVLGATGVGKTHAAFAALRLLWEADLAVKAVSAARMLDSLRPDGPEGYLDSLIGVDGLLIDDIGAERGTEWTAERLHIVIDERWTQGRPVIATSNLEPGDLARHLGQRTVSRLMGSGAVVLRIGGTDRRQTGSDG